jgi:hypothetical protein
MNLRDIIEYGTVASQPPKVQPTARPSPLQRWRAARAARAFRGLGAPPQVLAQAAAALVVALEDTTAGDVSQAAVQLLSQFAPEDRQTIANQAIALGANQDSVLATLAAAGATESTETINVVSNIPKLRPMIPIWAILLGTLGVFGVGMWWYNRRRKRHAGTNAA